MIFFNFMKISISNIAIAVFFIFLGALYEAPAHGSRSQRRAFEHNQQGISYLESGEFQNAIREFRSGLRYIPSSQELRENLAIAFNNYGFELMTDGRLDLALDKFMEAYHFFPHNEYTVYNLGRAYYKTQDLAKAQKYLEKAFEINSRLKGLEGLLEKVRAEKAIEKNFDTYTTPHFLIAASPGVDVRKVSHVRGYLEEAYGQVGRFLDHYPRNRIIVLLYTDHEYQTVLGDRPYWALALFDGKLRIPADIYSASGVSLREIIFHEYAHAVVYDIAADRCPRWLNEGIASKAESLVERRDEDLIKEYIDLFGLLSFWDLPADFSDIPSAEIKTLVYITSYLAVEFLISRYGYDSIRDTLDHLADGADIQNALYAAVGEEIKNIDPLWKRFVRSRYTFRDIEMIGGN